MKNLFSKIFTTTIFIFVVSCNLSSDNMDEQYINIHMHYGFQNEVNTFTNKLTKDLILDGTITVDFYFTTEEQFQIEETVYLNNFYSLSDSIKYISNDSLSVIDDPNPGIQFLRVKHNDKDKIVYWSYPLPNNTEGESILEMYNLIREIIESKPVYKNLPEPRGGYL